MDFIKKEFNSLKKWEKIFFPAILLVITIISFLSGNKILALIYCICSVSYTILAGKGKFYCYFLGLTASILYTYFSLNNKLYGQALINFAYYVPIQIIGLFVWKKHLKTNSNEIIKTCLNLKEKIIYFFITITSFFILSCILKVSGDTRPFLDGFATSFSIIGQFLTVKRCIEQWFIWFCVNLVTTIMWISLINQETNAVLIAFLWGIYLFLSIYFYISWHKEIYKTKN